MVKEQDNSAKILYALRPIIQVIPEVEKPISAISPQSKYIWTGIVVLVYLLCSQIPLYGMIKTGGDDPFYWMRVILASNRGTLMELGISPIVTASMIMQLLTGSKLININQEDKEEKELFENSQKLVGIIIAFGQAVAYTFSGVYGDLASIGAGNALLIVLQLTFASFLIIMLDDIMGKQYGHGDSATSLFIAINIAETFLWSCFSPLSFKVGAELQTEQYEGCFLEFFYGVIFGSNKLNSIQESFFRDSLPNISSIFSTVLMFMIVIFVHGLRVNLPLCSDKGSGVNQYPIKLFYTSNIPIILQSAIVSNIYMFSQVLHRNFRGSFISNIFGRWQEAGFQGQTVPVGGLIYYMTSPRSLIGALTEPVHALIYILFMVGTCAFFSRTWIDVSGQGPREVASNLQKQGLCMKGYTPQDFQGKLKHYIQTAAMLGGICTGLLTIAADFLGAIGSGTGIMMAVNIVYSLYQEIVLNKNKQRRG